MFYPVLPYSGKSNLYWPKRTLRMSRRKRSTGATTRWPRSKPAADRAKWLNRASGCESRVSNTSLLSAGSTSTSPEHTMTTRDTGINGRDLEHRPGAVSTTFAGRAVEIAGGIEDQAGLGMVPVRGHAEAM